MFQHLKVMNHKGIRTISLNNVGKINVLCGKNNSGKTSILEALNNSSHRTYGITITADHITSLKNKLTAIAQGYTNPSPSAMKVELMKALDSTLQEAGLLFFDELDSKKKEFNSALASSLKADLRINLNMPISLNELLKEVFIDRTIELKNVLIPPKRILEHIIQIDSNQALQPDGGGVVNFLFFLKNQPLGSREYGTYLNIDEAFKEVANGWKFNVFIDKSNKLTVSFTQGNNIWFSSDACGLGLSDILIIVTIILSHDYKLLLIEEPESHVHPDMQRRLLRFMRNIDDKQFILTTHSNVFLDNAFIDKVLFCINDDDGVKVNDTTQKASVLDDLGYSIVDNLISDLVVLVEGPKDIPVLEVFFRRLGFDKYNIRIWPLGGDIMAQVDLAVMVENRRCIALIDHDPGSASIRQQFIEKCKSFNIEVTQLKRYALENYYPLSSLRKIFGTQISDTINTLDPNIKLENQIGINVKNNSRKIALSMNDDEIRETDDLYEFIMNIDRLLA